MTDTSKSQPSSKARKPQEGSFWDWVVFWWTSFLHVGFPIIDKICGFKPHWTPDQMGSKSGQVSGLLSI